MTRRDNEWTRFAVSLLLVGLIFAGLTSATWAQQEEPVWKWAPEKLQQHVNKVRAGKNLKPKQWPNGTKVAVSISFDFDTEPVVVGLSEATESLVYVAW